MTDFSDLRPYNDQEACGALLHLVEQRAFLLVGNHRDIALEAALCP